MRNTASLPLLLKQLGLPMMYAHWEEQDVIAQKNQWTYPLYLATLSELEVVSRQQKRIQRHLKESKLPPGQNFSNI